MKLIALALRVHSCWLLDYRYWTNSMGQSPSCKTISYSSTREIRRVSWNLKIHCRVHNSRPLVPAVSHISPLHTLVVYSILILSSHLLLGLRRILFPAGITVTEQKKLRVIKARGRWLHFWHEPFGVETVEHRSLTMVMMRFRSGPETLILPNTLN
jgi:hypothetical protein